MTTKTPKPKPKAKAKPKAAKAEATPVAKPAKGTTLRCGAVSAYTTELAMEIARRTAEGKSFRTIAKEKGMPGLRTLVDWQSVHPEFATMLDRARVVRADRRVEQISDIAEQVRNGTLDPNRGRVAGDHLKWLASRENWMKWGDKQATITTNIPSPAEPAAPSQTTQELLAEVNRIAARIRHGKTAEQIRALEAGAVVAADAVEAEIMPPDPPSRPEITKAADAGSWEPPGDFEERLNRRDATEPDQEGGGENGRVRAAAVQQRAARAIRPRSVCATACHQQRCFLAHAAEGMSDRLPSVAVGVSLAKPILASYTWRGPRGGSQCSRGSSLLSFYYFCQAQHLRRRRSASRC